MAEGNGRWRPWVDFLVELFGSLMPGLVFTAAVATVLAGPLHGVLNIDLGTLSFLSTEVLVAVVCLSYVLGHIFFRQDPKTVDRKSVAILEKRLAAKEEFRKDATALEKAMRQQYACKNADEVEFPYLYLHDYLETRGLDHLLWFITWRDKPEFRTKIYINLLKIRLSAHAPQYYGIVARNEAHVRLMSSTWHLCCALIYISLATIAIYLMFLLLGAWRNGAEVIKFLPALLPACLVVMASLFAKRAIEEPFHYQRLREIVYVLETAQTVFRGRPFILTADNVFPHFGRGVKSPPNKPPRAAAIPRCFKSDLSHDPRCTECGLNETCRN